MWLQTNYERHLCFVYQSKKSKETATARLKTESPSLYLSLARVQYRVVSGHTISNQIRDC